MYPRNTNILGSKFTNWNKTGYTYDMTVYLVRDRQRIAQHVTTTNMTVSELKKKI